MLASNNAGSSSPEPEWDGSFDKDQGCSFGTVVSGRSWLRGSSGNLAALPRENGPAVVYQVLQAMSGDVQGGDIKCIFAIRYRPDALGLKNPVDLTFNIT